MMHLSHLRKSFNKIHHCTNGAFSCTTVHFHAAVKLATSIASAVHTKDSPTEKDQGWRDSVSGLHPNLVSDVSHAWLRCAERSYLATEVQFSAVEQTHAVVSACRSRVLRRLLYSEADDSFCTLHPWNLFDSRSSLVFPLHSSFSFKSQVV